MIQSILLLVWLFIVYKSVLFFLQDIDLARSMFAKSFIYLLWGVVFVAITMNFGNFLPQFIATSIAVIAGMTIFICSLSVKLTGIALFINYMKSKQNQKGGVL